MADSDSLNIAMENEMKTLFLLIAITTLNTALAKTTAGEALKKIIPEGRYIGVDDGKNECVVSVFENDLNEVEISIENETDFVGYAANNNEDYAQGRVGRQNVLFLQLNIVNGSEKSSVKIINSSINKLNVSVGNFISRGREHRYKALSCNI